MLIPAEKIDEIKNASDIVDVVGSYVKLVRKGRNYLGLCPFHQEKTPSFTVSPDKQMFYCFGCHIGGNVFSFLQQYDKLSFVDSVARLAERAGIQIIMQEQSLEKDKERESLFYLNQTTAEYFHNNLNSDIGRIGKDYFLRRDITEETIKKFILGFSVNSWEGFVNYAKENKLDFEALFSLGLVGRREEGSYFDNFRGRIMFPIFNSMGKISGFGGRKLFENDDSGKYINSKESDVYNKSKTLYGLNFSKEEIRRNDVAILVEGYMDFLTLYQNGIKNIVASSGTALTQDQVKILSRYTKNLLFLYDADMAGVKATIRGLDIILENDFDVKVVSLENNEDPDSYVRKYGVDKFKYAVDNASSFIKFMADTSRKLGKLNSTNDLVTASREMITLLTKVKDKLRLEFYLKEVAERFDISEGLVRKEYENLGKKSVKRKITPLSSEQDSIRITPERIQVNTEFVYPGPEEEEIIALVIMEGRKILDFISENLSENEIKSQLTKKLLAILAQMIESGIPFTQDALLASIEDGEMRGIISKLYMNKMIVSDEEVDGKYEDLEASRIKWAKDVLKKIKVNTLEQEINRIMKMIHKAESEHLDCTELIENFTQLHEQKIHWSNIE
jgi:DNA primase